MVQFGSVPKSLEIKFPKTSNLLIAGGTSQKMGDVPPCSTGDLANNIDKLRFELQQSKYAGLIDSRAWRKGNP